MSGGDPVASLQDILESLEEFGSASPGLIAWELGVDEAAIETAWQDAIGQRLIRATGASDLGEPTYQLTLPGRARLRELRRRSVPDRDADG